jgi:hypothetical protein
MKLWVSGAVLIVGWLGGLLLYVNYFSETERGGGDLVKAGAWVSLAFGIAVFAVAALQVRRHS